MEHSKIAALVELGILCRGEPVPVAGDGEADPGPHRYAGHNQLCRFEDPRFQHPFDNPAIPAYVMFGRKLTMNQALARTRLVVLLGMADSEELKQCLASTRTVVILFEPDDRVLKAVLDRAKLAGLNRDNLFCFTGDPHSFDPPLQEILPAKLLRVGTPAFFMTDRIRDLYGEWADKVINYLEVLHYRHVIYGLSGQALARSRPLRDIKRGLLYDQQFHVYENIPDYLTAPDIAHLKGRFRKSTAILVAAGPDLPEKFDYIRRNRDKAVVICVNNAVKPVVEAGIKPHFVIINDTSLDSGKVFKNIPPQSETILVGHCLSDLGGDRFRQKYLFDSLLSHIFGKRKGLKFHGSVISTAFALARHLGCDRCVLVGAQLCSDNPWGLSYARGTLKDAPEDRDRELVDKHPQLCPVTTSSGERLYTTLNFLDAAMWLSEEIRVSNVECVNTSKRSILQGPRIRFEEEPEIVPGLVPLARTMAELFRVPPPKVDRREVRKYLRQEIRLWSSLRDAAATMLSQGDPELIAKGMAVLTQMDKNNVTYLVERSHGFDNRAFYRDVFENGGRNPVRGLRRYYRRVVELSDTFLGLLDRALQSL